MKKVLALVLVAVMLFAFAGCGAEKSDSEKVKENGKLVVGITDFAPMDYQDENKEWIGFDADMAKAFAKELGVDVEFVEIEWNNKVVELNSGNIDCVWNGMTLTDEVTSAMDCSNPYFDNAQVVVVAADKADQYQDVEACKELNFAVEKGSAGAEEAKANGFKYTEVKDQATALMEMAAGTCDAAIIDFLMAKATLGEGTDYENFTYTISLNSEKYGVGFRKGSDLPEKLNDFFKKAYKDGTMTECAKTYKIDEKLLAQ